MKDTPNNHVSVNFGGLALAMFVVLKLAAAWPWSWWWLLMPVVPDLAFAFTKLGWL
jgi:hypothetical protein